MNAQEIIDGVLERGRGRAMLGAAAGDLLMECVDKVKGDYIEIGSGMGGSAIMAVEAGAERIFSIDPFIGFTVFDGVDPYHDTFLHNIATFNLLQKVFLFRQYTPPFPEALYFHGFRVGLIDGCHLGDGPMKDFLELDPRVTDYLLFDNSEIVDVKRVIDWVLAVGDWEEYKTVKYESTCDSAPGVKEFMALKRIREIRQEQLGARIKRCFADGLIPLY